jgi:hypothetical protein
MLHTADGDALINQRRPRHFLRRSSEIAFYQVEFLTLSSDADPDRYAHGDGNMRGHLEKQGHGHSEQFPMNRD